MAHIVTSFAWTFCKTQAFVAYCCGLVIIKERFAIANLLKYKCIVLHPKQGPEEAQKRVGYSYKERTLMLFFDIDDFTVSIPTSSL